jgi:hypothetical protein
VRLVNQIQDGRAPPLERVHRWVDVSKTNLTRESVRPAQRFGSEPCQVIDVVRSALGEQRAQDRIREHLRIEQLLNPVQGLLSPSMLVQTSQLQLRGNIDLCRLVAVPRGKPPLAPRDRRHRAISGPHGRPSHMHEQQEHL